uniref:Uncharacterized protein n=1 Tax=Trypanosoma congolense (strain IL3000) TaxID=1068625 RepID=G0URF9_TRYCI|nr:hypothetical protein, unlikely [Trypanosoma congolense IL3000]
MFPLDRAEEKACCALHRHGTERLLVGVPRIRATGDGVCWASSHPFLCVGCQAPQVLSESHVTRQRGEASWTSVSVGLLRMRLHNLTTCGISMVGTVSDAPQKYFSSGGRDQCTRCTGMCALASAVLISNGLMFHTELAAP